MPYPADNANKDMSVAMLNPVPSLVAALADEPVLARQAARERLTEIGPPAVPALVGALKHRHAVVRWEAAKALQDIADPSAAPALVVALDNDDAGVRWLAAEAL